jgi:alanine dehydrogenase
MGSTGKQGFSEVARQALLMPQEALMAVKNRKHNLCIGIPKEISFQENRIALTPLSVGLLVNNGHEVWIESGAGKAANFPDKDYSEEGAKIIYDSKEVYQSDIVIKVAPPTMDEITMMKVGQTLISGLQSASLKEDYVKALINKKITAIAYEYLRDEGGILTVVRSMSEIVGTTSIHIAGEYLSTNNGKGLMLGGVTGIPPTEIVIIGAGTVGEYAARTALALGADVKVFDNSVYHLRRLQNNIGTRLFTSVLQPVVLLKALSKCDVAIGAMRAKEGRSPCIVSEEMVAKMKADSVIIDVSIDQGGCFETSHITNHTKPVFRKHDVIHYCVPNIASRVARTASYALTNIFTPILLDIGEAGGIKNMLWEKAGVRSGVYIYNGHITNKYISNSFNLPFKDLDLLVAAQA